MTSNIVVFYHCNMYYWDYYSFTTKSLSVGKDTVDYLKSKKALGLESSINEAHKACHLLMSFVLLSKKEASYFNNIFAAFWFKIAFCEKRGIYFSFWHKGTW